MVADKHRRLLRERRERQLDARATSAIDVPTRPRSWFGRIYHDHYKPLFLITIAILLFSLITIGVTYARTGDVIHKGVSLSGGMTITVATGDVSINGDALAAQLRSAFPDADINVREASEFGRQVGITLEVATGENTPDELGVLEEGILKILEERIPDVRKKQSTEMIGPSLGQSFFQQTAKAVLAAFTMMGLVVFLYFGDRTSHKVLVTFLSLITAWVVWNTSGLTLVIFGILLGAPLVWCYIKWSIPSAAVILAAISTILFTVAVVDIIGMRISTAGIAAFLMLIGYSVDTDILLSNRVLKYSEGSVYDRVVNASKTGLTMTFTTMAASIIGYVFTQSAVIHEIMLIVIIGLVADIFYTWIQNAGFLRLWLEHHGGAR